MGATTTGLTELIDDLQTAADEVLERAKPVVKKAAQNIKTETRARWSGTRHAPYLPGSVTYDEPEIEGTAVRTEVGPDKDLPQGALGNLFEYGSSNNAARPGLAPAADLEEPRFAKALEDLGGDLLEGKVSK